MKQRIISGNVEQSADGGITWKVIRVATAEDKAASDKALGKKKTTKTKTEPATVHPYKDKETKELLEDNPYYDNPGVLYDADIAGKQAKNPQGGYGKQDYEGFLAQNKDLMERFERVFKRKYEKDRSEDVFWFQSNHWDQTYKDARAAGLSHEKAIETANDISFNPDTKANSGDPRGMDMQHGDWTNSRVRFKFKKQTPEEKKEEKKKLYPPAAYTRGRQDAPWWTQDVINTAAAAGTRMGLKKYLPWAPQVNLQTPRPTFYDPTRELASNAEQMQIGTQGAGQFAGPQAFNSRFSQIAGQGARNAADILGKYHNKNVGEANRFEALRTDIYNKNNMMNADVAKKLYDGTTIANQQFDNAKRQANNELRGAYVNAITNRAQTQTLNTMYPHFQVDPSTGGMLDFYKGSRMDPQAQASKKQQVDDLMAQGWSIDQALKFLGYGSDGKSSSSTTINQDVAFNPYNQQMQQVGRRPNYGYSPDYE